MYDAYTRESQGQPIRDFVTAYTSMNTTTSKRVKTAAELARQIECGMHRAAKDWACYENEHCALYESDLEHICPRKEKDRKRKLLKFAEQYGFRLKFYHEGACAIFCKRPSPVANAASALWLLVPSAAAALTASNRGS